MDIEKIIQDYQNWASIQFPNSTYISSIIGLKREVDELEIELNRPLSDEYFGEEDVEKYRNDVGLEYADCLMYLIDGARRYGYSFHDLIGFLEQKLEINKKRDWKINEDKSYSHIKP